MAFKILNWEAMINSNREIEQFVCKTQEFKIYSKWLNIS
jgi:hypothetical protein